MPSNKATSSVANLLLDAGLLQFGRFSLEGREKPFRTNLAFLPSYPDILLFLARMAQETLDNSQLDHLVSTAEALPIGIVVSLQTGIPLVYNRVSSSDTDISLVGAYDIGHPAALLRMTSEENYTALLKAAHRVGLEINIVITVISYGLTTPDIEQRSLLQLEDLVEEASHQRRIPSGQVQAVSRWIKQQNQWV